MQEIKPIGRNLIKVRTNDHYLIFNTRNIELISDPYHVNTQEGDIELCIPKVPDHWEIAMVSSGKEIELWFNKEENARDFYGVYILQMTETE